MSSKESGWPIPPPAPRTATFVWRAAEDEKRRAEGVARVRAAERANILVRYRRWRFKTRYEDARE